jgi:hypothetical protein
LKSLRIIQATSRSPPFVRWWDFADVIALLRTFDESSAAIAEGLSPAANTPERCAARRAVARRFDWDDVVCSIARTIAQRLGVDLAKSARG